MEFQYINVLSWTGFVFSFFCFFLALAANNRICMGQFNQKKEYQQILAPGVSGKVLDSLVTCHSQGLSLTIWLPGTCHCNDLLSRKELNASSDAPANAFVFPGLVPGCKVVSKVLASASV